jgi:hypothetical protein
METPKEILTELQDLAPLLGRGIFRVPYGVPAGYFEDFSEMLMYRIHMETVGLSEPEPEQEISEISPLLAGLQKKNPYRLPVGYFESWDAKIPGTESKPSRLVEISSAGSVKKAAELKTSAAKRVGMFPLRVIRYAAAACIVALLGTLVFNLTYHRAITDPIQGLTTVSEQDMANYLDSDDIHWTPGIGSKTETASVGLNNFTDNDIHELLSNVSDDELEQYSSTLPEEKGTVN